MRNIAVAAFALIAFSTSPASAGQWSHGVVKSRLICNAQGKCARAPYMHPEYVPDRTLADYWGPYPRYYHAGPLRGFNFGVPGWSYYY